MDNGQRRRRGTNAQQLEFERSSDWLEYRRACRKANYLINKSRTVHYRQRIEEAGSDHKRRWGIINELLVHSNDRDNTRTDDEN